jgi:4-hydroxythreonine-4-phosphate dehydrogenase
VLREAVRLLGAGLAVRSVGCVEEASSPSGALDVFDLASVPAGELRVGAVSALGGRAAFEAVRAAIELAQAGRIGAIVTGPLNKGSLALAGVPFPGHTEIFAHYTQTPDVTMMLAEGALRVVHVSTHVSLRQACDAVTRERVLKVIELAHEACVRLGVARPRIGVAGLNPHAGEGGLFGDEEVRHIIPAVADAQSRGLCAEGPVPPDTLFAKAAGGAYDVCVAMYHDQGHIPVKLLGFHYDGARGAWSAVNGINVTLGIPLIRVSVDHGTAFDQAGKGTASDASLVHALTYAALLARKGTAAP